jgi:hypothetical protein
LSSRKIFTTACGVGIFIIGKNCEKK